MALDFPSSPTPGQKYPDPAVAGLPQYTWDGTVWGTAGFDPVAYVAKAGDTMTGALTLPGDAVSSLQAVPKQQLDAAIIAAGSTTGDVKLTYKTVADAGWILANDGSIGNAASGATTRANADTVNLFTLFYGLPFTLTLQDSAGATVARGASAAADYAANRRLVIPKALGRSIAVAGSGSGLTARLLGDGTKGAETETPTLAKTAVHNHGIPGSSSASGSGSTNFVRTDATNNVPGVTASSGNGDPLNILDPSTYMNVMIKL